MQYISLGITMQYISLSILNTKTGLQVGLQQAVATQQSPTQVALHIHYVFQENMCTILHNAGLSLCTFYNTIYATINQQLMQWLQL